MSLSNVHAPPLFVLLFLMATSAIFSSSFASESAQQVVQLLSSSASSLSLVSGLTARFQCSIHRCGGPSQNPPTICWYKDDLLLFNGTQFEAISGVEPSRIILQRSMDVEERSREKGGRGCVDEEYTLLLRNLTMEDSGKYSCQLPVWESNPQQLDFNLDVIESGLRLNFSGRLSYDHMECCIERGVAPLCRPMCRPGDIGDEFFDPTSCGAEDYRHFLHCATDGGKRDYVPCCGQKGIPDFCFDFCTNGFETLKKSHRLCLYYLPDIFDCFSRQYALNPPPAPVEVQLISKEGAKLCWKNGQTEKPEETANAFEVHLRQMPEMPVLPMSGTSSRPRRNPSHQQLVGGARRKRDTHSLDKNHQQSKRVTIVVETRRNQQQNLITKIHRQTEPNLDDSSLICVSISGRLHGKNGENSHRFLLYMLAINDSGTSVPSTPIFVIEEADGQMHEA